MKKTFLITAITLFGIAAIMPSCNKKGDYTCNCTAVDLNMELTPVPYTNVKKKDAQKSCDDLEVQGNATGAKMECVLK